MIAPDFLFNSTCNIQVSTQTAVKGDVSRSYSGVSGIACAYMIDSESESAQYGRTAELNSYTVWLPVDTSIKKTDVIDIGAMSGDVVSVDEVQGRGVYIWVKCIEVK